MKNKDTVTLGVQTGDILSSDTTRPHFMPLRSLLAEHCGGPYSPEVDEFALVLRIDGDSAYWKQEGCDRMRRSKKGRYITIDIYVPRWRWQGKTTVEIRTYLSDCVEMALKMMIDKLRRDKTQVNGDALLHDWSKVKGIYLTP